MAKCLQILICLFSGGLSNYFSSSAAPASYSVSSLPATQQTQWNLSIKSICARFF